MSIKIILVVLIIAIIMMIISACGIVYYKIMIKIHEITEIQSRMLDLFERNNKNIYKIHLDIEEAYRRINYVMEELNKKGQ